MHVVCELNRENEICLYKVSGYHIAISGRRNARESTLINGMIEPKVSVVSSDSGTTTDIEYKMLEVFV